MDINNTEGDEGTQLDQENWLSVGQGLSSCVAAGTSLSDVNNRINYSNCVATANVGQNFGLENHWFDTYTGLYFVNSTGFNKAPFAPPSETSTSQASHLTEGLPRASDMLLGCNYMNIPQYEFVMPHRPVYDLNYPPGIIPESSSSQASHFAPETPGRILNATTERTNLRRDQQEDLRAASRFNNYELHQEELEIPMTGSSHATAIIDRNNNKLHDTQLQIPITGSSNTTAITPIIDNLNTDNGAIIDNLNTDKEGCNLLESNKTPQPKPKRKKHRPKVVIEDKTRRPPGPAASKPASNEIPTKRNYVDGSAENRSPIDPAATPPSGEKVYVRKYTTRAAATTFQAEATGETAGSENHQLPKKACRRTLNFDMEELTDESSQSRSTSDPGFEMQLKNKIGGNDSNPSLCTGQGVEVMMRATQAGIPYKVSDSGNQTLKENILLPERGKPDSVKSNPTYGEQNVKIHNNPQENGVKKKQTYGKEDQNMHINPRQNGMMSEQGNAPVVMLPIGGGLQQASLNGINCRDLSLQQQETSTVNHHFSLELPDSSRTNLAAVHCNNVAAYQLGSILQLPSICKKKRTEKKHTTLPGFSSSINAAKDAVKLDLTCQGWNHRRDASKSEESCRDSVRSSANRPLGSTRETGSGLQCNMQSNNSILTQTERSTKKRSSAPDKAPNLASLSEILWGPTKNATERSTKKRSQIHVRARNMSSLSEILLGSTHSTLNGKSGLLNHVAHQVSNSLGQCTHKKALVTELHASWKRKKRTKRISLINSTSSSTKEEQSHGRITLYNPNKFLLAKIGALPELTQKQMFSVDTIAEQFQDLDINRENCDIIPKAENALIPYSHRSRNESKFTIYRRDEGAIVPFKPTRKRHPLPRVDLDEETNRVWKLLLENIDNEGIDGTDEEKVKWWEEERKVFSGRANSFIARMRLVQGDRRFSPWKGSIVDSVIGVFLTQNVSDHLSSSAFMSLAARFPLKTDTKFQTWCEESSNSVADKQIVHILDIEDLNSCSKEETGQSVRNLNTMRVDGIELEDERELVNNESSGSNSAVATCGSSLENHKSLVDILTTNNSVLDKVCSSDEERTVTKDSLSSQTSASSSQIPFTSPTDEAAERKEPSKENILETSSMTSGSEVNCLSSHTFMELLLKHGSSMLDGVYSQWNSSMPTDTNRFNKLESMGSLFERQGIHDSDDRQSLLGESVATSSNYCLGLTSMSEAPEVECQKVTTDGLEKAEISNNCQTSLKSWRAFTEDSASQITEQTTFVGFHEQLRSTMDYPWEKIMQEDEHMSFLSLGQLFEDHNCQRSEQHTINNEMHQNLKLPSISKTMDITESISHKQDHNTLKVTVSTSTEIVDRENKDSDKRNTALRKAKSRRVGEDIKDHVDWDELRKEVEANGKKRERTENTMDSLDWEAVRCADVDEIAKTIRARGMNNMLAERIKDLLNRLVREHGSIDLEWLRDIPPDKAKEYLLSIRGLGLKSVECVRLLTLHHVAFPVDTNVGRIAVRLGWVPLQPLPESLQLHLLELYPVLESIQKYLWPRLCKLDQKTLYELHYQLITFGKVFCTKSKPNCNSCPLRGECRHFASAFASARLALPGPEERSISCATENKIPSMPTMMGHQLPLTLPNSIGQLEVSRWSQNLLLEAKHRVIYSEPIIEEPASPEPESKELTEKDIEDFFYDDPDEIPVIKLNIEEFTQNVQSYMQENMELVEGDMSKALVALTAEAASIPAPKLKNVSRLRTEHQVYELPDSHPLLAELERREPDDPCSYLLAIWSPGETADCVKQAGSCGSEEDGKLCEKATCFSCSSIREANSQIVRGTILIPCRTAMRGSFPLNGTYFQVNEVFADHESSLNPIDVPRNWIWNLPRRTVYFGTSIPSIFKGLTTELIQQCFWRGYVCVRGFDRKTRAPRPLRARLHFPASRLTKTKGVDADD